MVWSVCLDSIAGAKADAGAAATAELPALEVLATLAKSPLGAARSASGGGGGEARATLAESSGRSVRTSASAWESPMLSQRLERDLDDALCVASDTLPPWTVGVVSRVSALVPFAVRFIVLGGDFHFVRILLTI